MTSRLFLALFMQILCSAAVAQAPPPIPPIADTDRIQTYNITSSTAQVQVGFPVFGDCTDITVTIAGVTLPPATVGPWNCASQSGQPLSALPLPITDMVVNFNPPLTSGSVTIAGAWHPRNLTVPTASGISRREYEQATSTLIASQRELFYELNNFLLASAPQGSLLYRGPGGWAAMPQGFVGTALIRRPRTAPRLARDFRSQWRHGHERPNWRRAYRRSMHCDLHDQRPLGSCAHHKEQHYWLRCNRSRQHRRCHSRFAVWQHSGDPPLSWGIGMDNDPSGHFRAGSGRNRKPKRPGPRVGLANPRSFEFNGCRWLCWSYGYDKYYVRI
jgi:hypothetical protein